MKIFKLLCNENIRIAFLIMALSGFSSIFLGQDSNWDLLNYHFYNPYALLNGRLNDLDLAPAQLQTYFNPIFDIINFTLISYIKSPLLVTFLIGLINGIGIFFLYKISYIIFENEFSNLNKYRIFLSLIIGITGSIAVSTLGTTFNEWLSSLFILASIYYMLKYFASANPTDKFIFYSSFLVGFSAGGKLTNSIFVFSSIVTILVIKYLYKDTYKFNLKKYSAYLFLGFIFSGGYWFLLLFHNFQSPLFPLYNDIFNSPWYSNISIGEATRFTPKTLIDFLLYPIYWGFSKSHIVSELDIRDPRIFFVIFSALFFITVNLKCFDTNFDNFLIKYKKLAILLIYFFSSYFVWLFKFSIYRYILPLELISGIIILLISGYVVKNRTYFFVLSFTMTVFIVSYTIYPNWGRIKFTESFFSTSTLPSLPKNSLLVLIGDQPLSYIVPLLGGDFKTVGIENNFLKFNDSNLLSSKIKEVIKSTPDHIFSASSAEDQYKVDRLLEPYELFRVLDQCSSYNPNVGSPIIFCPLTKSKISYLNKNSVELLEDRDFQTNGNKYWSGFSQTLANDFRNSVLVTANNPLVQTVKVEPLQKYINSLELKCDKEKAIGRLQVNWLNSAHIYISTSGSVHECTNQWVKYSEVVFAPPGAGYAHIYISGHTNSSIFASNPSFKKF